jgi:glycosyltransferase involved in cell wall biosynthesis
MKILHINPVLACGGAEILTGAISLELAARGHDVTIACLMPHHKSFSKFPDRELLLEKVDVQILSDQFRFRLFREPIINNISFKNLLDTFKPDIVHSHLFLSELYSRSTLDESSAYITHGHDNMPQLQNFSAKTLFSKKLITDFWERRWLLKQYVKTNNQFIAISKDVEYYLKANLPHPLNDQIHFLKNAIDIKRFKGKKERFFNSGKIQIVSVASLVTKKNHRLLVELAAVLKSKAIQFEISVYGEGYLLEELKQLSVNLGVQDCISFKGTSGEIPTLLHEADLYIHPALYEPFGLVLLEAMASGLPIISLDGFGNRELIVDGTNGFFLPNDATADDLAKSVERFIEDPSLFEKLSDGGLNFVQQYGIENYVDKLLKIYEQAIDSRAKSVKSRK